MLWLENRILDFMSNCPRADFCSDFRRGHSGVGAGGIDAGAGNRPRQDNFAKQYIGVPNQQNTQYFSRPRQSRVARNGADNDVGEWQTNGGNSRLDCQRDGWCVGAKSTNCRDRNGLSVMHPPGAVINKTMFNIKKILVVTFALLVVSCFFSSPPPDKSMEEKFRSNEAAFKRLVMMMREDMNLASVDIDAAYLPSKEITDARPKAEIPAKRFDEYRRLLKQIGVNEIRNADSGILFLVWQSREIGLMNSGHKNYLYTETLPSPLLDSLDDTSKLPYQPGMDSGYKKIAENWYLEFIYLH